MKLKLYLALALVISLMPVQTYAEELTPELDDIQPYDGMFPPEHALYRFKLMLERMDEGLTFNPVKRMEKKMNHAQTRLAEAKRALMLNKIQHAEEVMLRYKDKMVEVTDDLVELDDDDVLPEMVQVMQMQMEQHRLSIKKMAQEHDLYSLQISLGNEELRRIHMQEYTGDTVIGTLRNGN